MANKFWKFRNVFVTGATGLLGSWLVEELTKQGANVVCLVRDFVPDSILLQEQKNFTGVRGELEDFTVLERALNEYEIETVFHLGAQTIVGTANRNPLSTFSANIEGTWKLLEAARRVETVKRIVVASSDKAYGDHEELPYDENTPLIGRHPYDVSKTCADLISQSFFHSFKLPVCVTRCGNLYGGGDLNWNRLIPGTIRSLYQKESPIIRSDGTYIRDYFYVKDAVQAYMSLAEKMDDKSLHGEAFNFSNELQIPVKQMVEKISTQMGSKISPKILNEANNEIKHQYLSARKAREHLGWKPLYSVEESLKETIDWYCCYLDKKQA